MRIFKPMRTIWAAAFFFLLGFSIPGPHAQEGGRKVDQIQVDYLGFHTGMTQAEFLEKIEGRYLVVRQSTLQKEGASFVLDQTLSCEGGAALPVLQVNFRSLDRFNRREVWGDYEVSNVLSFEDWKNIMDRIPSTKLVSEAFELVGEIPFAAFLNSPDGEGVLVHYVFRKPVPHAGPKQIRESFLEQYGPADCDSPDGLYYFRVAGRYDLRIVFSDEEIGLGITDSKLVSDLMNRWLEFGKESAGREITSLHKPTPEPNP